MNRPGLPETSVTTLIRTQPIISACPSRHDALARQISRFKLNFVLLLVGFTAVAKRLEPLKGSHIAPGFPQVLDFPNPIYFLAQRYTTTPPRQTSQPKHRSLKKDNNSHRFLKGYIFCHCQDCIPILKGLNRSCPIRTPFTDPT